jgi:hypothetical protein
VKEKPSMLCFKNRSKSAKEKKEEFTKYDDHKDE